MDIRLSVILITKNAGDTLAECIQSIHLIADEIVVVDDFSTDNTVEIASDYNAFIHFHHQQDLGKQKHYALTKARGTWILSLDSDEIVSLELLEEIKKIIIHSEADIHDGYYIPYINHFLGKPLRYGGENYKMLRLFKKKAVSISDALVHEHFSLQSGKPGTLKHAIYHYSYRSIPQMIGKFTAYALREAEERARRGETSSIRKVFLHPLHMFWARFVESGGYRDGFFRIPLDIGFAYMEFLMYMRLALFNILPSKPTDQTILPV